MLKLSRREFLGLAGSVPLLTLAGCGTGSGSSAQDGTAADGSEAPQGGSDQATTLAHLDKTSKGLDHYQPSIARDIYLRLTVNSGKADFAYSLDGTHFVPAGTSLTLRPGKWIGAKVGFVAQEPEGNGGRGWLDIDWCRLTP